MPKIGRAAHGGQTSIGLVMYLGEDDGTQNVPIWEHESFSGPE